MSQLSGSQFTVDEIAKSANNNNQIEENEIEDEIIDNYEYEQIEEDEKEEINSTNKSIGKGEINNDNYEQSIPDKTIFSKIAEDMYNKMINNEKNKKTYNYEDFINDQFLANYSDKINNIDNNQVINNFLNRNNQYIIDKNNCKDTVNNRIDQIKFFNLKKLSNDQVDAKIKEFNDKQLEYSKKRKKEIEELTKKLNDEKEKDKKNFGKPKINHINLDYLKKKVDYKFRKRTLSQNKNNNSYSYNTIESKKNNKMSDEKINNLVKKLHNEAKELKLKISKSSDDFYKNKRKQINYTSKTSKRILFNNFIKQYQREIKNIKSIPYSKNPIITFDEFKILLEHMHFINEDTEINIIKDIWKELTSFSSSNKKESDLILIFILCMNGLYKKEIEENIKKTLKWINFNKYEKLIKKKKDFESKYSELRKNRNEFYNNLKSQKDKEYLQKKYYYTEESQNNRHNSFDTITNLKRKKLSETYNLILEKRKNRIEELRDENEKKDLKECTFNPITNKKKLDFHSSSANKYSIEKVMQKQLQKKTIEKEKKKKNYTTLNNSNSSLNEKMFNEHPISQDYNVKQEIFRYQEARNLRKKINNQLNKGSNFISSNKNLQKEMCFGNERNNNKETFDKFYKIPKSKIKKEPLISFEIQIRNKTDILTYFRGDDPDKIIQKFVKKHNLTNESKRQIKKALEKKLELL